jgi:hypothetical protein
VQTPGTCETDHLGLRCTARVGAPRCSEWVAPTASPSRKAPRAMDIDADRGRSERGFSTSPAAVPAGPEPHESPAKPYGSANGCRVRRGQGAALVRRGCESSAATSSGLQRRGCRREPPTQNSEEPVRALADRPLGALDASRGGSFFPASQGRFISGFRGAIFRYYDSLVVMATTTGTRHLERDHQPADKALEGVLGRRARFPGLSEGVAPRRWVQFSQEGSEC